MVGFGATIELVGRENELAVVLDAARRARRNRPAVLVVEGEPGLGKSRLVQEAIAILRGEEGPGTAPVLVAVGHGTDVAGDRIPFGVAASVLGDLLAHAGADWASALDPRVRSALAALHPTLGAAPDPTALDRLALLAGFREVLVRLGATHLVCLAVEDLHWADESSLDLLALLARTSDAVPLLVLATVRPIDGEGRRVVRHVADLGRGPHGALLTLHRLPDDAVLRYLRAADDGSWPPGAADRISHLAQGVPLFLEALVGDVHRLDQGLPTTIAALVIARLQGLTTDTRRVLEAAAVRGHPVDRRALTGVTGLDDEAVGAALQEAGEHRLLDPLGGGRYRLHHALERRAIEESIGESAGERWHHRWATWLSAGGVADATLTTSLAHHWYHSGDTERAITAALDAARVATGLDATLEASLHWTRVLQLWPVVADPRRSTGMDRDDLVMSCYWALRASGEAGAARDLVSSELAMRPAPRGVQLLWLETRRFLGSDPDEPAPPGVAAVLAWDQLIRLARRVLRDPEARRPTPMLLGLLATLLNRALPPDLAATIDDLLDGLGDEIRANPSLRVLALHAEGYRLVQQHRHEDALRLELSAEAATDDVHPRERHRATANVVDSLTSLGRFAEAVEHGERALAGLGSVDVARGEWLALAQMVTVAHLHAGGWARAHELFAVHLVNQEWFPIGESAGAMAVVAAQQGRQDDARAWTELAVVDLPGLDEPSELIAYAYQPHLARACLAASLGDVLTARGHLRPVLGSDRLHTDVGVLWQVVVEAARLAVHPGDRPPERRAWTDLVESASEQVDRVDGLGEAWTAEVRAHLDLAVGTEDPDQWLEVATRWEALGLPYREAVCRTRRAAILPAGRAKDVRADLERARSLLVPLGAKPALLDVQRLAGRARLRLSAGVDGDALTGLPALTVREMEVATLIADGRTNQQIAAVLFMSPKTASVHVSRIIMKLGVQNRTEVAALVHRSGVVDR